MDMHILVADNQCLIREGLRMILEPEPDLTAVAEVGDRASAVERTIDFLPDVVVLDISFAEAARLIRTEAPRIKVRIPLTMAIIESLLVKIGTDFFVLPLSRVDEGVELNGEQVARAHGRNLAHMGERLVPYIPLSEHFRIPDQLPPIEQIVITRVNGVRVGFVVDQVTCEYQTVIKSLGLVYRDAGVISGATILGEGNKALILQVPQPVQEVKAEAVKHVTNRSKDRGNHAHRSIA
jgi:CheY-like chemotaxis protein